MIKKLILICLLASSVAFAMTIDGVDTTAISTEDGVAVADIASEDGVVITSTSCPSYYNTAGIILSMDFENGLNACDSSGNTVLFTDSGATIGAYGETGQGLMSDASDEDITFTQTSAQYVNENADQTICMRVNFSGQLSNGVAPARFHDTGYDDMIELWAGTAANPNLFGGYNVQSGTDAGTAGASIPGTGNWYTVAYSWQGSAAGSNGDHALNPGDNGTWASGWDDEADELVSTMTTAITVLRIGNAWANAPGNAYYIDAWALVGSYKFDCSTLF